MSDDEKIYKIVKAQERIFNTAVEIGEVVGTYGTDEQVRLFKLILEDYKSKNAEYFRLKKENKELKTGLQFRVNYCRKLEQELYGEDNIELTKIEKDLLKE